MTDKTSLIALEAFLVNHARLIGHQQVIPDSDLAELFDVEPEVIRKLTRINLDRFKNNSLVIFSDSKDVQLDNVCYAYTDAGIFILAGLIKTKRAIRIYVKLVELLVNNLQYKAYDIASIMQGQKE